MSNISASADDIRARPSYPEDADLTDDEKSAMARQASMARANSPNELMCQVDNVSSNVVGIGHTHDYATCMAFREQNVISDQAAWIYWEEYDDWAQQQPTPPLPPVEPPPPEDWFPIARIVPDGISQMDNIAPANGNTFAVYIDPSVIVLPVNPPPVGATMRVKFSGLMTINEVYIADVDPGDPNAPWVSTQNLQLTFGGLPQATAVPLQSPTFDPYGEIISDPFPIFDPSNGLIISFYIVSGNVGRRVTEPGWSTSANSTDPGSVASSALDKSSENWGLTASADLGVLMVEWYFLPDDDMVSPH